MSEPRYAELHCLSSFSFLRGASQPEELVRRAIELGYDALAITDECSVAGVVRAHAVCKARDGALLQLIVGAEFRLECGLSLVILAADRRGYGQLCRLITRGRRAAEKGAYRLARDDVLELIEPQHCLLLWIARAGDSQHAVRHELWLSEVRWLAQHYLQSAWIAVELLRDGRERRQLARMRELCAQSGLPLLAAGAVCMHVRERRRLHDALTAIRLGVTIETAGLGLLPNGERHLRPRSRLARLYPAELLEQSCAVAARCRFSLDELRYEYPREIVPEGKTPAQWLRELVERGAARRWEVMPASVRSLVEHELALIEELGYEPYFLTVHDLVEFARSRKILCQGRGSAANSAVCYCLGITEVDPARLSVLFERFISRERNEPPDIDVDFEHERREEVIQYVYEKYGRERAALAATVICYRPRSVLRDLGKALGFAETEIEALGKVIRRWDRTLDLEVLRGALRETPREAPHADARLSLRLQALCELGPQLLGFPRHLSQHVGGFVIARDLLEELVPIENASMPQRTVIQWDKDDLDALGLLKVDVLALGMLSVIRRALQMTSKWRGRTLSLADIPPEDPRVYDMICRADTVGVFQIESRAQMAMLPRLQPRNFYDLVIEVAIVRPGPIQGDMVHPYLRRRCGEEPVDYPSEAVAAVLQRTLGVPIFQEQVMQLAVVAAGFSPGEADQLRRAMAAWKRQGGLGHFGERLINGMRERGYSEDFAQRLFAQIQGFGEYGFPESHAASFALLVYVSAWLKCHEPAAFTAALLNSQPMGFYAPAQLLRDVRAHGVNVLPIDVNVSEYDCVLEVDPAQRDAARCVDASHKAAVPRAAIRLGLCLVGSLSREAAERIVASRHVRAGAAFGSLQELADLARLDRGDLEALAAAGACASISGNRHQAFWAVAGTETPLPLAPVAAETAVPLLARPSEAMDVVADYGSVGFTLGRHPLAFLRPQFAHRGMIEARELDRHRAGDSVHLAGLVVSRQRPSTASGVTFVTLEDETGNVNLIVWRQVGERHRQDLFNARLLEVSGRLQREGEVQHVIVHTLRDRSAWLGRLLTRSRDFR